MKRLLSISCAVLLAGAMALATVQPSEAGNGRRGALIAGLIIGGVTAGIAASHLHSRRHYGGRYGYRQFRPQYYSYRGQRHRFGRGHMWRQHVSYCYNRYRSYNHNNNLFLAYSGHYRHCRSPFIH
ncbi:MAG: BA14K family protein [Pseudomonadota bacterium]